MSLLQVKAKASFGLAALGKRFYHNDSLGLARWPLLLRLGPCH